MIIRRTITTASISIKPPVCGMPGTMDWPKKLSNQYIVNTRMISSSKEVFLSGLLAGATRPEIWPDGSMVKMPAALASSQA
jgi:hypothetical protein